MSSNHHASASNKENISPNRCEVRHVCKKTKAVPVLAIPISLKAKGKKSTSTLQISPPVELADQDEQHLLISLAYGITGALDVALCLQSANRLAKELTESPLAEVTDAFASH